MKNIKNSDSLLLNIAHGLNQHNNTRLSCLEVVFKFDGEIILKRDVPTALDYLANDIHWDEESDWSNAEIAEVRVL